MNVWKKKIVLAAVLMLVAIPVLFSAAQADSGTACANEMMGEGIIPQTYAEQTMKYKGDNSIPSVDEMMVEGIPFPQAVSQEKEYAYDASAPSAPSWANEGMPSDSSPESATETNPARTISMN